ncbi:poly-beta-hydroxybutyrate polymerase N-terminal domain-containing protein [Rhodoferax sp.]
MKKSISFAPLSKGQPTAARPLGDAFHSHLTQVSLGLSPISLALAYAD